MVTRGRKSADPLSSALGGVLAECHLVEEFRRRWKLGRAWESVASGQLAQQSWVLGYRDGVLTVGLSSAAVATQLRFEAGQLVRQLQDLGLTDLVRIESRVRPQPEPRGQRRHRRYSPGAAARLAEQAESIPDEDLRASLYRLASHLGQPPGDNSEEP